jgi:glutaconate CoA-transferase subunit B
VTGAECTVHEFLAVAISRSLRDGDVGFTGLTTGRQTAVFGTGVPLAAMGLARYTHAPDLTVLLCGWVINPQLEAMRFLPELEFSDAMLEIPSEGRITGYPNAISYKRGHVDVGFSTGAQVDQYGNLNSVQIGHGAVPQVRLVGPILQPEHFAVFRREIITMPVHSLRTFVSEVSYRSGVGHRVDGRPRADLRLSGNGPDLVISPYGVFDFQTDDKRMRIRHLSPGVTLEQVGTNTSFELATGAPGGFAPTQEELDILRTRVDPHGVLLGGQR